MALNRPAYRLYRWEQFVRWFIVGIAWTVLLPWAIYQFREDISILMEYFTLVGVQYSLAFKLFPTGCILFTVVYTLTVIVRECLNGILGLSSQERNRLNRRVKKIQMAGPKHPLWKWIFKK